jgi:RNA ligase (TIGR02306 family)
MERKLASIRQISEIRPIEGADAIELAIVDGWNVVVAKNVNHKVGDYVVYCEIDSFLPIKPEFEFLRKSSYKKMGDQEGFRLKTIKLRGQISQGLILPLDEVIPFPNNLDYMEVGKDVTELLGIVKYEPPIPTELAGKVKGLFPSFIRKTDEERVQNLVSEYENWKVQSQHKFYVTEKLDGSSATFYYKDGVFGVCSRNLELLETEGNTFWKVARELDLENKMKEYGNNISIQGELIGEGIQGNPYKIKGQTVKFFTGYDIDKQNRINFVRFVILLQSMGLEHVPVLELNPEYGFVLPETVEEMLKYSEGKSELTPNTEREGVVVRSVDGTISFKAISNKFLLKND